MTDTLVRDRVARLAKSEPVKALAAARKIADPWFRAQALAYVARYSEESTVAIANEAARAAKQGQDAYQQVAVRAWEVAALAETGHTAEARKSLSSAERASANITPVASRAEALFLLMQAAAHIGAKERDALHKTMKQSLAADSNGRVKRALRDAQQMAEGSLEPREFFW